MKFGYAFVWVEDVEDTVRFYEEAFGVERRFIPDNGEFGLYAEMKTGETTLAIADEKEACTPFPNGYHENDPSPPPSAAAAKRLPNLLRHGGCRGDIRTRHAVGGDRDV